MSLILKDVEGEINVEYAAQWALNTIAKLAVCEADADDVLRLRAMLARLVIAARIVEEE